MNIDPDRVRSLLVDVVVPAVARVGLRFLAAFAVWMVGRRVIAKLRTPLERALTFREVDPTAQRYLVNASTVALTLALVLAVFGVIGVETATVAALLAGAGLAVGTAWGDFLKNFAAGVFILALRPFRVGDIVSVGGVTGTVQEIGMFLTVIDTADQVRTLVGNQKVFSETIQNFTANPLRRIEVTVPLEKDADVEAFRKRVLIALEAVDGVAKDPSPEVRVLQLTALGPVVTVRPHCVSKRYWEVYFATSELVREAQRAKPTPEATA